MIKDRLIFMKNLNLSIKRASINDLDSIMNIYESARKFMSENGNPTQWKNNHPPKELIIDYIDMKQQYICLDQDQNIVGTFAFIIGEDPTYKNIYNGSWLNNDPYSVIHAIATSVNTTGVGTYCLEWCFNQINNVRIDTHENNIPMQNLLAKLGYIECGIIYLENKEERIAFHKIS